MKGKGRDELSFFLGKTNKEKQKKKKKMSLIIWLGCQFP